MKDLSLSNALRYMFSSVVAYSYLYIADASLAKQIADSLGVLGIISFVFLGSVIYLFYRALLYNTLIMWIQDFFRRGSNNYRTYFKAHYNIGTYQAQQLWIQIKDEYFKDRYSESMKETASGIHLIYLAGFIAIPFTIWMAIIGGLALFGIFLSIILVCFLGAFRLDKSYEDIELRFLYSLDDTQRDDLHQFVTRILRNVQQTSSKGKSA